MNIILLKIDKQEEVAYQARTGKAKLESLISLLFSSFVLGGKGLGENGIGDSFDFEALMSIPSLSFSFMKVGERRDMGCIQ